MDSNKSKQHSAPLLQFGVWDMWALNMCWIHKLMHKYLSPLSFPHQCIWSKNDDLRLSVELKRKFNACFALGPNEWEVSYWTTTKQILGYNVTYTARQNQLQALMDSGQSEHLQRSAHQYRFFITHFNLIKIGLDAFGREIKFFYLVVMA